MLVTLISLLVLATKIFAAVSPPSYSKERQLSVSHPRTLSTAAIDNATVLNSSSLAALTNIDPRFTYTIKFTNEILDKKSAYFNTLLALADLSTKGWTARLKWDTMYTFSIGIITIRIHASSDPSDLQYRYAIWGLYRAISEISANEFKECVLTLYWSPILGRTRHTIGYLSILGPPSHSIDSVNSTEDALELALPTQATSLGLSSGNLTTLTVNDTTFLVIGHKSGHDLRFEFSLEPRRLDVDAVFHTIYMGIIDLASLNQFQRIMHPGVVQDDASQTYLRWDASLLVVEPYLNPSFLILAMSGLPVYMNEKEQYQEARFIVYVDQFEVGRGWLYRHRPGEASDAD